MTLYRNACSTLRFQYIFVFYFDLGTSYGEMCLISVQEGLLPL